MGAPGVTARALVVAHCAVFSRYMPVTPAGGCCCAACPTEGTELLEKVMAYLNPILATSAEGALAVTTRRPAAAVHHPPPHHRRSVAARRLYALLYSHQRSVRARARVLQQPRTPTVLAFCR